MRSVIIGGIGRHGKGRHGRAQPFVEPVRLAGKTRIWPRWGMLFPTMEAGFQCASCGEWNITLVDESAGRRQSYVEDCQVCCKPNVLRIEYDNASQEFFITAELE